MIQIEGETYLLAAEAARHLNVSRPKFYRSYKALLQSKKVGQFNRKHYRVSDLDRLQVVEDSVV